jgi:excisionase family DNA binding protein
VVDEEFLTVAQAAERLQLNQETVRVWLRTGKLKGTLLGGKRSGYRIPRSEVERVLREGPTPTPGEAPA